jgi:hypothetical protein
MKTKHGFRGVCSNSRFLNAARVKSAQVVAMSLFATFEMMAQNQNAASSPANTNTSSLPSVAQANDAVSMPPPVLQAPKPTKNEVSVSGDVMIGQGTITLPLGYSLDKSLGNNAVRSEAFSVPRNSTYYGGTISYSYGQAWFIDLSYAQGQTTGTQSINTGWLGSLNSNFSIDDTWYQIYFKYTFPQLRGKRFSAYLRAGATYVTATIKDNAQSPAVGRYTQNDSTVDTLGNLGFGLGYSLYTTRHMRFGLQMEGEGFYGVRSQQSMESLSADQGLNFVTADINNTLYGGIGRATMRLEYRLGQSGLFKIFVEGGGEVRYTMIQYPGSGSYTEDLWGPYAKLGVRYDF